MSKQAWRLTSAAAVVAVTGAAVLLVGRDAPDPMSVAVVAAERWRVGSEPGGFVTVAVPEELDPFFVAPEELGEMVPAVDVAEGTVVSPAMLMPGPPPRGRGTVPLRLPVDASLWPDPGPQRGRAAVLSPAPGGCAAAVLELASAVEGSVTVEVTPAQAGVLGGRDLFAWPALDGSWPLCPPELVNSADGVARVEGG